MLTTSLALSIGVYVATMLSRKTGRSTRVAYRLTRGSGSSLESGGGCRDPLPTQEQRPRRRRLPSSPRSLRLLLLVAPLAGRPRHLAHRRLLRAGRGAPTSLPRFLHPRADHLRGEPAPAHPRANQAARSRTAYTGLGAPACPHRALRVQADAWRRDRGAAMSFVIELRCKDCSEVFEHEHGGNGVLPKRCPGCARARRRRQARDRARKYRNRPQPKSKPLPPTPEPNTPAANRARVARMQSG